MTYWNHICFTVALSFAALSPPLHAQTADNTTVVGQSLPLGAAGVAPEVNIAALKKLFSDPHYSVVDGLDTDMADFSQAAPQPLSPPPHAQKTAANTIVVGQSLPLGGADVAPEVNMAALKILFSDPHYSVVDGLDTDMADFSQDAPLPLSTLRQMTSAKTVNMFKDDVHFPFAANSFVPLIAEY
jgi:hypothetical protein